MIDDAESGTYVDRRAKPSDVGDVWNSISEHEAADS